MKISDFVALAIAFVVSLPILAAEAVYKLVKNLFKKGDD